MDAPVVISIRRISLGGGFRYLMDAVAADDGNPERSGGLSRYYAASGTPPGVFLGAGLADLDDGLATVRFVKSVLGSTEQSARR